MGLTKQYLRYAPCGTFNIIASSKCNAVFVVLEKQQGRFVASAAGEHVIVWDLRLKEKSQILPGDRFEVTRLEASPNQNQLAVGYTNGNVHVFDLTTGETDGKFAGHRSDVTALAYDVNGHCLASGSKDTDIIIWDVVAETGLCRLTGHKGQVTQIRFANEYNVLISSSKDTFIKFWDLNSQYCFKTIVGNRSEVTDIILLLNSRYLIGACAKDQDLTVWKLTRKDRDEKDLSQALKLIDLNENDDADHPLQCHKVGVIKQSTKNRVLALKCDHEGRVLICLNANNTLDLFSIDCDSSDLKQQSENVLVLTPKERIVKRRTFKLEKQTKQIDLIAGDGGEVRFVTVLTTNILQLFSYSMASDNDDLDNIATITSPGHRSEIRAVSFSSDEIAVVSGSGDCIKLWNRSTLACLRTIATGYVLCVCFIPGDRHVLVGQKDGSLLIVDISTGDVLETIAAHQNELWSICLTPDQRGCITGGGDNTVKFWQFELVVDESSEVKAKVLSLLHMRTLTVEDNVLHVRVSSNNKYLAVALLDSTVKIFFVDSLKFFLSLYGHKLPVLCLDMSTDSTLIATGSGDRNVKIWGLDFGDCHRSLFAHEDSVTALQFVPRTHYFFTSGRDGKIKQWDADSFVKIITLQGHFNECWSLAVSPTGKFVVSCGADKFIRLWEKTDEPLVLEDEAENEREMAEEKEMDKEETVVMGRGAITLPTKKTIGSEKAAESILECLDICQTYDKELAEYKKLLTTQKNAVPPTRHVLMQAYDVETSEEFLAETIKNIRASDLEEALVLLPFTTVCDLLKYLPRIASTGRYIELTSRLTVFLLRLHFGPIRASGKLLPCLLALKKAATTRLDELKDLLGYNYHSLMFIQREIEESQNVQLFRDATVTKNKREKIKKNRTRAKRALVVLHS